MNHYRLDADARDDLVSIHKFVTRENPTAADRLMHNLKQKFRLLASHPLMGQQRPELAADLRSFSLDNYVVFYRPMRNGIQVARVIHAARDIGEQF